VFEPLQKWFFSQMNIPKVTVDFDSTVITRYGEQEGSRVGYNPQKLGRRSHYPIIAFEAVVRMLLNVWMRPGNKAVSSHLICFLEECFRIIDVLNVGLIRADRGYYTDTFMGW
jgi:hypothetical protein